MLRVTLAAVGLIAAMAAAAPDTNLPPKSLGSVETYGANLQRSMSLIAGSSGLKRNTVRILFYGQSITAADWTRLVAERLRRQYPLTNFVIENRALPGFHSGLLSKTAEADLYPFYPDLVIFHDYGEPRFIEDMIRRLRERTTTDILIATDHLAPLVGEKMDEETNPLKLIEPKQGGHDAAWRSYVFLPTLARKYHAELADVRTLWKQYIRDHKLRPSDLLYDDLHLNERGNRLMAEIITAHLRFRPDLARHQPNDLVTTVSVGEEQDLRWNQGKLVLSFEGNKVDLICRDGAAPGATSAAIRIDGRKPSEFQELYQPSRVQTDWPRLNTVLLLQVKHEKPRLIEDWTMTLEDIPDGGASFRFRISGSVTGPDGDGISGRPFVSKSGRVAIGAEDFHPENPLKLCRDPKVGAVLCSWQVVSYFADEFTVPAERNHFGETVVIAAQGLPNGKHTLEISGGPDTPLAAIRVHRPPLRSR